MVKCSRREVRELKKSLRWKKLPEKQRRRVQMVLLREQGLAQPAIAAAMGVSLSTINRAHMAYDQRGIKARESGQPSVNLYEGWYKAHAGGWRSIQTDVAAFR
jgi:hypothetical protein